MDEHFEAVIPSWLEAPPIGKANPPVETRSQELPFGELTWENFEKLCLRLARLEANVEHCQLYGVRGQDQEGIDIYARHQQRLAQKYRVYQCKRVKDFGSANIKDAVSKFLKGKWVSKTDTFVLCTQVSLDRTELADEIETQSKRLKNEGITFLPWGSNQLSIALKDHPKLVEDFFGRAWVAAFCGREQADRLDRRPNAEVAERYSSWLRKTTTHFTVPGLGIELPIETAWIQLQAYGSSETEERDRPKTIEEWLASYHEWSRLAVRREDCSQAFDADYIAEFNRQIVVIGGSGSGKSTLLRRVAHRLSGLGKRVLLIRLPYVAKYFDQGKTFEEAILKVAADGSGIEIDQLQLILANPDYLLADGLDECEPQRATIANALFKWAAGHSHTRVVVTTRPVGHDAGLLPGWEYAELLPLDPQGIKKNAQQLIKAKFTDKTQLEEQLALFEQRLETNRTASLAARNPLLLGFLVQLSINGVELVQHRAGLYESIIELVCNQSLPDRELKVELDASTAFRVIEMIGWILQDTPGIPKPKLLDLLGKELADELGIRSLAARIKAEEGLKFWEERRIIERLSIGHQNAVTFVHPSLGEYAAGRYASSLSEKELRQWLERVRRKPKWRESILFCAGAGAVDLVSSYLLELDNPEEATSAEAVLAVASLLEVSNPPPELLEKTANRLQQRLNSDLPFVVFEAAEAALQLAELVPNIIGSIAQSLLPNKQPWTHLAAVRIALTCGDDYVDLDNLIETLDAIIAEVTESEKPQQVFNLFNSNHQQWYGQWDFQNQVVFEGIKLLVRKQPGSDTNRRIKQVLEEGNFMGVTCISIQEFLRNYALENLRKGGLQESAAAFKLAGYDKLFAEAHSLLKNPLKALENLKRREQTKKADQAFLEAVLRATDSTLEALPPKQQSRELVALGVLYKGMGWSKFIAGTWDILSNRYDLDAVDAVLRGAIAAMEINPQQLATEAGQALEQINYHDLDAIEFVLRGEAGGRQNESEGLFCVWEKLIEISQYDGEWGSLYSQISKTVNRIVPKWERAIDISLPSKDLVRALKHPSRGIYQNATLLLMHGAGGAETADLVREALREDNEQVLWAVSNIAPHIWGNESLEIVIDRLNKPLTKGCYYLLKVLPDLPGAQSNQLTFQILLRGLKAEDIDIATIAAEALSRFETAAVLNLAPQLIEAFDYWTERGTWCKQHQISTHGNICPKCRALLPSPRAKLVRLLVKLGQLSLDELVKLCSDLHDDVQRSSVTALVEIASTNHDVLGELLAKIKSEALPTKVLTKVFSLPTASLRLVKRELINLYDSPSAKVRKEVVQTLAEADWFETEEAIILAQKALQDHDLAVRDQAVETLRILESQ